MQEHLARKILKEDGALQLAARRRPRRSDPMCHRASSRDQEPACGAQHDSDGRCGTMGATAQSAEAYGELLSGPGPELVRLGRQVAEQTQQRELCDA
mmetsp:Transcript_78850/g.254722  ORF Transcript_78850/g.254722 Transcript_78850/m.254722 type:complete len:97 (-) Transcript_78850:714-1004(-)